MQGGVLQRAGDQTIKALNYKAISKKFKTIPILYSVIYINIHSSNIRPLKKKFRHHNSLSCF